MTIEFVDPLSWETVAERDRSLAMYVASGQMFAETHLQETSSSMDKVRLFGKNTNNCIVATPANVAWWAPPQDRIWEHFEKKWSSKLGAN